MLVKHPKKNYLGLRFGVKFFIIFEGIFLFGSYVAYTSCNRSQATRKYFHDHFPLNIALEFYYKCGELYGTEEVRKFDQFTWNAMKNKPSDQ